MFAERGRGKNPKNSKGRILLNIEATTAFSHNPLNPEFPTFQIPRDSVDYGLISQVIFPLLF